MNFLLSVIRAAVVLTCVFTSLLTVADDAFPLRGEYQDVKVMELETLASEYNDVFIVDVRSRLEFDVIHIASAVNITMSNQGFENKVKQKHMSGKKIVVYCNGHTCSKSYKAARRLTEAGLTEVYAFDAGIMDWTLAQPERSVLLSESPADTNALISKEKLSEHMLSKEDFLAKTNLDGVVMINVQDNFQRMEEQGQKKELAKFRSMPVDNFSKWIKAGNGEDKILLITDAVGRQVQWLQYYLERYQHTDYYFLEGGAKSL